MAVIRTLAIRARIIQTDEFTWTTNDFEAVRGRISTHEITGDQGQPRIDSPAIDDITLRFWEDIALGTEVNDGDTNWAVGDQNLDDVFSLVNFVEGADDITVEIQTDTTGVTEAELMAHALWNSTDEYLDIFLTLEITQPD